jgi:hypothetical protein
MKGAQPSIQNDNDHGIIKEDTFINRKTTTAIHEEEFQTQTKFPKMHEFKFRTRECSFSNLRRGRERI